MPENDRPAPVADVLAPAVRKTREIYGGEARAWVEDFIRASHQGGPDAATEYERALAQLQHAPQEVTVVISMALGECQPRDYARRWALIFAACELRHRAVLPLLSNIVSTPLPLDIRCGTQASSILAEETILRTTAIEGIGRLIREDREQTLKVLFGALRQPSISIRRAVVQAILSNTGEGGMRQRILAYLPPEEYFLLELKTPRVTEVRQPTITERDTSERTGKGLRQKAPALPEAGRIKPDRQPPESHGKGGTQ